MQIEVLQKRNVGKEYRFVNPKDSTLTILKYLGQLSAKDGTKYSVVTSIYIFGLSHMAHSRILVFSNNKCLGSYYVGGSDGLPDRVKDNKLVFTNLLGCDRNVSTKLSFKDGIPKQFFKECKSGAGDVYTFSKE